jgi:hypothetical protein
MPVPSSAAELTVGRHAAPDGSSAHPLVVDALARRPVDVSGAHRDDPGTRGSGLGWPAPPAPDGGGLGWPKKDSAEADDPAGEEPVTAVARRRWRRFFRASTAA